MEKNLIDGKLTTDAIDTGGKFTDGAIDTGGKFTDGAIDTGGKFTDGAIDTGGKFAAGVVDTGNAPLLANISENFWKNSKWPYCYFQGLGGRWFMKKT